MLDVFLANRTFVEPQNACMWISRVPVTLNCKMRGPKHILIARERETIAGKRKTSNRNEGRRERG